MVKKLPLNAKGKQTLLFKPNNIYLELTMSLDHMLPSVREQLIQTSNDLIDQRKKEEAKPQE